MHVFLLRPVNILFVAAIQLKPPIIPCLDWQMLAGFDIKAVPVPF